MWGIKLTSSRLQLIGIFVIILVAESSRGLVLPSFSNYVKDLGGDNFHLGLSISLYSIGRLIFAFIFGWLYNKQGVNRVITLSLFLFIGGHILYFASSVFGLWCLVFSRLIIGSASGILSVTKAHIVACTNTEERVKFIGYSGALQFVGFSITPGIAIIYGENISWSIAGFVINVLTMPGLILLFMNVISLFIWWGLWYKSVAMKNKNYEDVLYSSLESSIEMESMSEKLLDDEQPEDWKSDEQQQKDRLLDELEEEQQSNQKKREKAMWIGVGVFLFLNFTSRGVIGILETLGTPLFIAAWDDQDNDEISDVAEFYVVLGCIGTVVFLLTGWVKITKAFMWTMIGFAFVLIGTLILSVPQYEISLTTFSIAATLILSIGGPILQTLIISAFSIILGTKPQGVMMGLITNAGSLGRIVLPFTAGFLPLSGTFIEGTGLCIISMVVLTVYKWWLTKK